ncbi:hypothetical protein HKD37_20G056321 [Glycine soja]
MVPFIMDNNPWEFLDIDVLDLQSFVRSSNPNLSSSSSTTLILVIIVKTGTPNSFGDMKVTLKTVKFCPFPPHSKCYLNIILQNVVKAMFLNFRLPIILVFTNLHPMLICC